MSVVKIEQPTAASLKFIADNMRREDAVEVMASHGYTPHQALEVSVKNSSLMAVIVIDGIPVTALGLVKRCPLTGLGVPWLLSAEQALNHKRKFLELSPPVIEDMLDICPKLVNYVHAENRTSIRWLRWLGFKIDEPTPIGIRGEMFHRFHKER